MTNEEAIKILEDITWNSNGRYEVTDMLDTRNLSIQALQENTKLKAEIEILKESREYLFGSIENYKDMIIKLESEIDQLKSELEQSVRLPCKLKDTVYEVVKCNNGIVRIFEMKVCNVCEYGSFHNGSKKKFVWNIYMEDEKGFGYSYGTFYDFGKTIFLTREEAEQSLKGAINSEYEVHNDNKHN